MTDQPVSLEPSSLSERELDIALARDLFDWRHGVAYDQVGGSWIRVDAAGEPRRYWAGGTSGPLLLASTGDGMLLVLEAMRERGFLFDIEYPPTKHREHAAVVVWPESHIANDVARAVNDSLPRAVAEAALQALAAEGASRA